MRDSHDPYKSRNHFDIFRLSQKNENSSSLFWGEKNQFKTSIFYGHLLGPRTDGFSNKHHFYEKFQIWKSELNVVGSMLWGDWVSRHWAKSASKMAINKCENEMSTLWWPHALMLPSAWISSRCRFSPLSSCSSCISSLKLKWINIFNDPLFMHFPPVQAA